MVEKIVTGEQWSTTYAKINDLMDDNTAVLAQANAILAALSNDRVDVYVDGVAGSDENSGTQSSPFATLAKAATLAANGARFYLNAGSTFRETFDLSAYTNTLVQGYGDLNDQGLPAIDAADGIAVALWEDSTARGDSDTNIHSIASWTTTGILTGQDSHGVTVFEDNDALTWVSSIATCQSTAGSFTVLDPGDDSVVTESNSELSPVTLYVHPTGSTDPTSNGSSYTATARGWALRLGDSSVARWVRAANQGNDNGAINGADDVLVDACVVYGSPVHAFLASSGKVKNTVGMQRNDDARSLNRILEFYRNDGVGYSATWENCIAAGPAASRTQEVIGFGGHTATSLTPFDSWTMTDCFAWNCDVNGYAVDAYTATRLRIENGIFANPVNPSNGGPAVPTGTSTVTDFWQYVDTAQNALNRFIDISGGKTHTMDGLRVAWDVDVANMFYINASGVAVTINNSAIWDDTTQASRRVISVADAASLTITNTVYEIGATAANIPFIYHTTLASPNAVTNTNAFNPGTVNEPRFYVNSTQYTDMTAVQAAGYETSSVAFTDDMTDPANGDFSIGTPPSNGAGTNNAPTYLTTKPASIADAETWVLAQ